MAAIILKYHINSRSYPVEEDNWENLAKDTALLVEPALEVEHRDFIIVHKNGQKTPTLKQALFDERQMYLKPVAQGYNIAVFTPEHKVLGVIVEILNLSAIPGETQFTIQVTHKNCIVRLSAAEIINSNYNLNDFSDFHAETVRQAALGKLIEFLKLSEKEPAYKIVSKRFDAKIQQYIFTIESKENIRFTSTAEELSRDKNLLSNIGMQDIYDIGYTQGTESILKEKAFLLLAKQK